jgi:hypothetical protein
MRCRAASAAGSIDEVVGAVPRKTVRAGSRCPSAKMPSEVSPGRWCRSGVERCGKSAVGSEGGDTGLNPVYLRNPGAEALLASGQGKGAARQVPLRGKNPDKLLLKFALAAVVADGWAKDKPVSSHRSTSTSGCGGTSGGAASSPGSLYSQNGMLAICREPAPQSTT